MNLESTVPNQKVATRPGNLRPFLCALVALIPVYIVIRFSTGLTMLAVAGSALAALMAFVGYRVIQFRGRLSLSIVVIGFPLMAAILFATYQSLAPFRERQKSISMLRVAGITYGKRLPDQVGEWKRDHRGMMLPVWLADRIGPDSMTSLRSIDANLDAFQGIEYSALDMTELSRIQLTRLFTEPDVDPKLIDWLNQVELKQLSFSLVHYSDDDADALSKLTHPYGARIYLSDRPTGDLSALRKANYVNIVANKLSTTQAQQLCQLNLHMLNLEVRHLPAETIDALQGWESEAPNMMITGAKLDADRWRALSRLPVLSLRLTGLDDASIQSIPDSPPGNGIRRLNVSGNRLSFDEIRRLVQLFRPTDLFCTTELSEEQIEALWPITEKLTSVSINVQPWPTYTRP